MTGLAMALFWAREVERAYFAGFSFDEAMRCIIAARDATNISASGAVGAPGATFCGDGARVAQRSHKPTIAGFDSLPRNSNRSISDDGKLRDHVRETFRSLPPEGSRAADFVKKRHRRRSLYMRPARFRRN